MDLCGSLGIDLGKPLMKTFGAMRLREGKQRLAQRFVDAFPRKRKAGKKAADIKAVPPVSTGRRPRAVICAIVRAASAT